MTRRRWWLVGAAALSVAAMRLLSAVSETEPAGDVDVRAASYAGRIGLRLPPGTRAEFAEWMTGLDDAARLVLVMPEIGWVALRAELPATAFDAEGNHHLGPNQGRWAPSQAPGLISGQLPWQDGRESLNLGVALAGPGEVRIFVFWHQL